MTLFSHENKHHKISHLYAWTESWVLTFWLQGYLVFIFNQYFDLVVEEKKSKFIRIYEYYNK